MGSKWGGVGRPAPLPDSYREKMKKNYLVIVFGLLVFSCGQTDVADVSIRDYDTIIDVRTKEEYDAGHLSNAINIPYTKIKEEIKEHVENKKTKILLYCRSGRRSGIANKILHDMGYINAINAGAFEMLKKQELESRGKT